MVTNTVKFDAVMDDVAEHLDRQGPDLNWASLDLLDTVDRLTQADPELTAKFADLRPAYLAVQATEQAWAAGFTEHSPNDAALALLGSYLDRHDYVLIAA